MGSIRNKILQRLRRVCVGGWHKFIIGRKRHSTVVRDGVTYQVPYIGIGKGLICNRLHEVAQWSFLHDQVKIAGSEVFLDIGAHIGTYALRMASAGLCEMVYAVEGSQEAFRMLSNHIELNNFGKHMVGINAVAHDRNETIIFYDNHSTALTGWSGTEKSHSRHENRTKQEGKPHKIQGVPLDQIFSFRERKLAIKIDVEGHELNVLQGAIQLLTHNSVFLQIEIWPWNSSNLNWLYEHGFKLLNRIEDDYFMVNYD